VPRLVDTSIRVLGQEPLAGVMPTSALLELAEILDGAGFAYLEVSGGGVFDAAVRRGVESPWERNRALKARTTTPLALALRGRFLVGSRPVGGDISRRFVASAAESGIDVFRLHDPLNDVDNLRDAAEAILAAGREFDAGLLYGSNRRESLVDAARRLPELGATRVLLHDPAGLLQPARAAELVTELREVSQLPVGLYSQGAGRNALAIALECARRGADLIACSVYPVALAGHRVSAEAASQALAGLGQDTGVDEQVLWRAADLVDEHIGDTPTTPLVPRIAVRAARRKMPVAIVSAADAALTRAVELVDGGPAHEAPVDLDSLRAESGGLAASEEEALLLALFGTEAEPLLRSIRRRAAGEEVSPGAGDRASVAFVCSNIGRLDIRREQFAAARAQLVEARELAMKVNLPADVLEADLRLVECSCHAGESAQALAAGSELESSVERGSIQAAMLYRLLGFACLMLGEVGRARAHFTESLEHADLADAPFERGSTLRGLAYCDAADGFDPMPRLTEAEAVLTKLGVVAVDEPMGLTMADYASRLPIPAQSSGQRVEAMPS
jgi:hypothetical protein